MNCLLTALKRMQHVFFAVLPEEVEASIQEQHQPNDMLKKISRLDIRSFLTINEETI
jgi:hypothetical protein